jgi:IS605 OrfB family transposase
MHHCSDRQECVPYLIKKGKRWYLRYSFKKKVSLNDTPIEKQVILAVDLGINRACVCSAMLADGTVIGRHYLKLPKEKDCLEHAINRIKKAQKNHAHKMPVLWAKANGINNNIAVKTAVFITETASLYDAYAIVFEHLDLNRKKRGSKKQRLALWRARYVQSIVTNKAHMLGIHITHINAWKTSALAYDGSGLVGRDEHNHSICTFQNGKQYDCDLSASYNIGARYFIREILKTFSAKKRSALEAKVPHVAERSTCTLSDLINLNAEIRRQAA